MTRSADRIRSRSLDCGRYRCGSTPGPIRPTTSSPPTWRTVSVRKFVVVTTRSRSPSLAEEVARGRTAHAVRAPPRAGSQPQRRCSGAFAVGRPPRRHRPGAHESTLIDTASATVGPKLCSSSSGGRPIRTTIGPPKGCRLTTVIRSPSCTRCPVR